MTTRRDGIKSLAVELQSAIYLNAESGRRGRERLPTIFALPTSWCGSSGPSLFKADLASSADLESFRILPTLPGPSADEAPAVSLKKARPSLGPLRQLGPLRSPARVFAGVFSRCLLYEYLFYENYEPELL